MSSVSTIRKTAPVMASTSQYASEMRSPFGETGSTGEMPPFDASAAADSASAPATSVTTRNRLRRTGGWHSTNVPGTEARVEARVEVPAYVGRDFEVFVNGIPQMEGRDYRRDGRTLVFAKSLAKEGRLGTIRWLSMLLGVAGTYRQNDSVDLVYESGGRRLVAAELPIQRG